MKKLTLSRKFRYNGRDIEDPAPDLPPHEAVKKLIAVYPELATAKVAVGETETNAETGQAVELFNITVPQGSLG
jgi:PRTRC genetic system protein C